MSSFGPITLAVTIPNFSQFLDDQKKLASSVATNRGFLWRATVRKDREKLFVVVACKPEKPNDGYWRYLAALSYSFAIVHPDDGERKLKEQHEDIRFAAGGAEWSTNGCSGKEMGYICTLSKGIKPTETVVITTVVAPGIPEGVREKLSFNMTRRPTDNVTFRVDNELIHANKQYLSVVSPVFERMFAGDFAEKHSEEISLDDVTAEEFLEFIAVLYPTEYPIQDGNVLSLVKLAERFDIQTLLNKCLTYLESDTCGVWIEDKFFFATEWNFDYYKKMVMSKLTKADIETIRGDDRYKHLARELVDELFDKHLSLSRK